MDTLPAGTPELHQPAAQPELFEVPDDALLESVITGLRQTPKRISPVWFYDERGSHLFDQITELPEYYVTRTELAIMRAHLPAIAAYIGPRACVVEPGSGTSLKTRLLLDALDRPSTYVPVDVAREHLAEAVAKLRSEHPGLAVHPICADFTQPFEVPRALCQSPRVVYFPGSTIGNFDRRPAIALLRRLREVALDGAMLIGVDMVKDPGILVPAYDDAKGVTAAFNRNALSHLNRALGANFDPQGFRHRAVWNPEHSRIEMHLVSRRPQRVTIGNSTIGFAANEALVSEHSHKYTLESFASLARAAGWRIEHVWLDSRGWFSLQWLVADPHSAADVSAAFGGRSPDRRTHRR